MRPTQSVTVLGAASIRAVVEARSTKAGNLTVEALARNLRMNMILGKEVLDRFAQDEAPLRTWELELHVVVACLPVLGSVDTRQLETTKSIWLLLFLS